MAIPSRIRLGTRGSRLALKQADMAAEALRAAHPDLEVEIVPFVTSGDRITDRPLAEAGGKGLFTKELEEALLAGHIDAGVHSLKDMETVLPPGLSIAACLAREDARDALLSRDGLTLEALPLGARIGTSSVRRQAQLALTRPDLIATSLRGNVPTRIEKLKAGGADAIILAVAGLKRIGLMDHITEILPAKRFLPAAGQGIVALECGTDSPLCALFTQINDRAAMQQAVAERAVLAGLNGSCRTPIAAHAWHEGDQLCIRALIATMDGSFSVTASRNGSPDTGEAMGYDIAQEMLMRGAGALPAMKTLLITRPEPDARALAELLQAKGFHTLIAPTLVIEPCESAGEELNCVFSGHLDGLLVTSRHALAPLALRPDALNLPLIVVGEATAGAAHRLGFTRIQEAGGDASALVAAASARWTQGGRLLYVRGQEVTLDMRAALAPLITVEEVTVYRARLADALPETVLTELHSGNVDGVVFFSRRSAEQYVVLAKKTNISLAHQFMKAFALSPAVSSALSSLPWQHMHIAQYPTQASILQMIESVLA